MEEPGYERYLSMEAFTKNPELWDVEKKADHKKGKEETQWQGKDFFSVFF